MKKPVKSPFVETKTIEKNLNSGQIIEMTVDNFAQLLRQLEEDDVETNSSTLLAYMAGVMSTLRILGFDSKHVEYLIKDVGRIIFDEECDCPNCKKENETTV